MGEKLPYSLERLNTSITPGFARWLMKKVDDAIAMFEYGDAPIRFSIPEDFSAFFYFDSDESDYARDYTYQIARGLVQGYKKDVIIHTPVLALIHQAQQRRIHYAREATEDTNAKIRGRLFCLAEWVFAEKEGHFLDVQTSSIIGSLGENPWSFQLEAAVSVIAQHQIGNEIRYLLTGHSAELSTDVEINH